MPYIRRPMIRRPALALRGFGDFNDESPCTSIPAGDAYRKPGNYCATADGGYTTFNADGSTFVQPADPSGPSFLDKLGIAIAGAFGQRTLPQTSIPITPPGMSTTTKVALAGGALLLVVVLARR